MRSMTISSSISTSPLAQLATNFATFFPQSSSSFSIDRLDLGSGEKISPESAGVLRMAIETFADKVDELLKAGDGITRDKPDVLTFLNSNWIEQHILSAVANGISKLGVEVESVRDAMAVENPAFLYRGRNADGVWRRLILRSAGNSLPYHSTFREPFAIVAISNLVVDEYGIIGTKGEDWYYRPSRDLRLEKKPLTI